MNHTPSPKIAFEFEYFINYEAIVCAHFPDVPEKVNASCMGVHFVPNQEVYLHVEENTHTHAILQHGARFSINFSEDFREYVTAGLKQLRLDDRMDELAKDSFLPETSVPLLKSAWCAVECCVIEMPEGIVPSPMCRRRQIPNVRAKIEHVHLFHYPRIFNNRATNLALEALIYTTKIPLFESFSAEYTKNLCRYLEIKKSISEWRDMDRFREGFDMMDTYLLQRNVKASELFDF